MPIDGYLDLVIVGDLENRTGNVVVAPKAAKVEVSCIGTIYLTDVSAGLEA